MEMMAAIAVIVIDPPLGRISTEAAAGVVTLIWRSGPGLRLQM